MLAKDPWRNNLYTKKEGVTAVSRMAEEHIFYKNAWTKKLKTKSLKCDKKSWKIKIF